jgi:basic membrane lipoprotein Med (substrate-binding protein (PBP1-ABC) superfamily)
MQDASMDIHVRVSYLAVQGESTLGNVLPYLSGLLQRGCDMVLATGPAEVSALATDAGKYPKVRFVAVGGVVSTANVSQVSAIEPSAIQAQVKGLIVADLAS